MTTRELAEQVVAERGRLRFARYLYRTGRIGDWMGIDPRTGRRLERDPDICCRAWVQARPVASPAAVRGLRGWRR